MQPASDCQPDSAAERNRPFAIETHELVRRFGEITALNRVSVKIRQGEFFSLLGPSGCGKTTLLRMIAGLDSPDTGTLVIAGQNAEGIPAHRRPVNTVFQSYALFPHMSVEENIAFGLRIKRTPPAEMRRRIKNVMAMVQVTELSKRRPSELSGGQKQRVALARAIVNEPKVLLLDEPLGALDHKLRKQLQVELHQLQRRLGITFVYVTHDQDEALTMSDRIGVMKEGSIVQLDTPERLYERPASRFVASFLGSCNIIEGTVVGGSGSVSHAEVQTALGNLTTPTPGLIPGRSITLGFRPEKIKVTPDCPDPPAANQWRAKVIDVVYCGPETQYRLQTGSIQILATTINGRPTEKRFSEGELVICSLEASAVIYISD